MRRTVLIVVCALALSAVVVSATPVRGQTFTPSAETFEQLVGRLRDERRGLVFDGLRRRPGGPCGDAFEIVGQLTDGRVRCTHGPDPAPDGVDVRVHRDFGATAPPSPSGPVSTSQAGIPCYGTGSDGYRVQLVYVRQSGTPDRSASLFPNFASWAANADATFADSATRTGGVRHIRYVTDSDCNLAIQKLEVSASAISDFSQFVSELRSKGLNRSDRKYFSWVDANTYCGIGEIYLDDRSTTTPGLSTSNASNGRPTVKGTFARVDNGCWGLANPVEAHEITHALGAVQRGAPNATSNYHCRDEPDRMCYVDAPGVTMVQRCAPSDERLLDCNNDDYFTTSPVAGSWLATHWNVANSAFLATSAPGAPPPTTSPPPPPTTSPPTTTTSPPTTSPPTTAGPPTSAGPTTTTGPSGTPSAPRNLRATGSFGQGVRLSWSAPSAGRVTGYNVYRRSGSGTFAKVADVSGTSYVDSATSSGVRYTYAVSAENGTREGPQSSSSSATAR